MMNENTKNYKADSRLLCDLRAPAQVWVGLSGCDYREWHESVIWIMRKLWDRFETVQTVELRLGDCSPVIFVRALHEVDTILEYIKAELTENLMKESELMPGDKGTGISIVNGAMGRQEYSNLQDWSC